MTNHTIEITADNQPTVLERLLQVTRYRGFVVTNFTVVTTAEKDTLDIELIVYDPKLKDQDAEKSSANTSAGLQRLYHQLNKLFDIKQVNLLKSKDIQCQA